MNSALLSALSLALYLAAAVCYGAALFLRVASTAAPAARKTPTPLARAARYLLVGGLIIHFFAIGALCLQTHRSPFAGIYGTLSITAWLLALTYLGLDFRIRLPSLGAVTLAIVCVLFSWGMVHAGGPVADSPVLSQRVVTLHVLAIIASFGLFALGGGCAALYLLQNRQLKTHGHGGLFRRLPPLAKLDTLAYHSVSYGLPLLTVGLAMGIVTALQGRQGGAAAWITEPKVIVSFGIWLLYLIYIGARLGAGWRGVRLQYILLIGLLVALALYAIPSSLHRFG